LSKLTTIAAVVFMLTSLALAYVSGHKTSGSIMKEVQAPIEERAGTTAPLPGDDQAEPNASLPASPSQAE
jgi:preprotein translocase subunit SecG